MGFKRKRFEKHKNPWNEKLQRMDDRKDFQPIHSGSYALDEEIKRQGVEIEKSPKHKVALVLGYCGTQYKGMQINPGTKTIEAEVERALFLAGGILESNFGNLQKIGFSRAARTDKGVHAAAQVVSCKLMIKDNDDEAFLTRINDNLPNDIRALNCIRVTKKFNAKQHCTSRVYEYLIPTYCFMDIQQMDEIFNEIQNLNNELNTNKEQEIEANNNNNNNIEQQSNQSLEQTHSVLEVKENDPEQNTIQENIAIQSPTEELKINESTHISNNKNENHDSDDDDDKNNQSEKEEEEEEEYQPNQITILYLPFANSKHHAILNRLRSYRIEDKKIEEIRKVLGKFCGTHKFHNYTSSKSSSDGSVQRYVTNFEPGRVFIDDEIEWMSLLVTGQSFLLHQIRKMVAMCVEVVRGNTTEDMIDHSFQPKKMVIHLAPSTGLFLNKPYFEYYNKKFVDERPIFNWESDVLAERVNHFKTHAIFPHIINQEKTKLPFVQWLYYLYQVRPKYGSIKIQSFTDPRFCVR